MQRPPEFIVQTDTLENKKKLEVSLDGLRIPVLTHWTSFANRIADSRAAAVFVTDLAAEHARDVARLRYERPSIPLVLITAETPSNFKALNSLPQFDEVLFPSEIRTLPDVLRKVAGHGLLLEAAAMIEVLDHLPPDLRATLLRACRRRDPVRTTTGLAHGILGAARQTLWKHWHAAVRAGATPHDFVDWLLIAHAVGHWHPKESLKDAAKRVGVHADTLAAALQRCVGHTDLAAVAAGGKEELLEKLRTILISARGGQVTDLGFR